MLQTVRITSKRQITIPSKIFSQLNLNEGDRLIVEADSKRIVMKKTQQVLDEVAGFLNIPKKFKKKSLDFIIREAKKEYFISKK